MIEDKYNQVANQEFEYDDQQDPHLQIDPSIDARNHPANEGRSSLFDLTPGDLFFVEGILVAEYETHKDSNIRLTFENVLVRPYRHDEEYEQLPVCAFSSHVNSVRKRDGLAHQKLKVGERSVMIGMLQQYTSRKWPGLERRSFKLFRDPMINKDLNEVENRIRRIDATLESIAESELPVRINKTEKMVRRVEDIVTSFKWIPHITESEVKQRLSNCQMKLIKLNRKVDLMSVKDKPKVLV
jgi:hypothetical protein